jgi:uncharacterized YccA/Bax inhibitor family protein
MRTSNPTLQPFQQPQTWAELDAAQRGGAVDRSEKDSLPRYMTIGGTINATMILLGILSASALVGWMVVGQNPAIIHPAWIAAFLATIAIGFGLRSVPTLAPVLSFVYAVVVGFGLGAISFAFATWIDPAIVFQALILTFGILFSLLAAFRMGLIRIGGAAKRVIIAATGGVMILYIGVFLMNIIGLGPIPFVHQLVGIEGGMLGIGFSLFVVVLASLNLVLDFQLIEEGAQQRLPKYMEWYAAFALLTTLVWLYIEILRLLAKLRR